MEIDSVFQSLAQYFEKFPGIGPRQAKRFVYFLLTKDKNFLKTFSNLIFNLKNNISECILCQKFFEKVPAKKENLCQICQDPKRNRSIILVVEKDVDLEKIEKAGVYNGLYFVLRGLIPLFGNNLPSEIKLKEFFERIKKEVNQNSLKEVILAFNATPEGENTVRYLEKILEPLQSKFNFKISRLGKGLSTGTELEYSDKETILNAFKNRQ